MKKCSSFLEVTCFEKVYYTDAYCRSTVLYFCLEDNYNRIQDRLYKMNAAETECLYFTVASERIGSGLEEQIVSFAKAHPDLKLVVIDVMQLIRSETSRRQSRHHNRADSSYAQIQGQRSVQYDLRLVRSQRMCRRKFCSC